MLMETEVFDFLTQNYKEEILKQSQNQENVLSIEILLKLDLTKIFKKNNVLGQFIIGKYCDFLKLSEKKNFHIPEFGVNIRYSLTTCPLPKHNIENVEFLTKALQHPQGVLVYLKQAYIMSIGQPQIYLHRWVETWHSVCGCKVPSIQKKFKQSLIEIIKNKNNNFKNAKNVEPQKCPQCSSKMKSFGIQQQIYLNCQKLKIHVNMKQNDGINFQQIFQQGIMQVYVDQTNMKLFKQNSIINLCIFYVAETVSKISMKSINLKISTGIYVISIYSNKGPTSINNLFFGSLRNIPLKYRFCSSYHDYDTILQNYQSICQTINRIKFPYLSSDSFTALKLCVINSIFSHQAQNNIHLLLLTDQIEIVQKAIQLNYLRIKKFPTSYEYRTLQSFLYKCYHSIVLVVNPSKNDIQYINLIVGGKILQNLNITFWVVMEPNSTLKKEIKVDEFCLILDLSFQNNFNVCSGFYQDLIDRKLSCFLPGGQQEEQILTIPRHRNKNKFINQQYQEIQKEQKDIEAQRQQEDEVAKDIIKNYFLKSRDYKKINNNTITHVKSVAEGFAHFRSFLNGHSLNKNQNKISILDAILAIFLDEQTCRHRYSKSNTLFANQISKLILNEGNCQLSFWDLQEKQDGFMEENKKYISKDAMFKRMLDKLIKLVYEDEIW